MVQLARSEVQKLCFWCRTRPRRQPLWYWNEIAYISPFMNLKRDLTGFKNKSAFFFCHIESFPGSGSSWNLRLVYFPPQLLPVTELFAAEFSFPISRPALRMFCICCGCWKLFCLIPARRSSYRETAALCCSKSNTEVNFFSFLIFLKIS